MKKFTLPNGLTVILEENHTAPVVTLQMWVKVGSALEKPHEAGIAHVFEHMLFKGTRKRGVGEIAMEVEACGGDINAYTSYDETVYYLILASRFFDSGLDILADAIRHSAFDPAELAKETEVVIEEIKRGEDMPSRKLSQKLFSTSYRVHPYHRPIIGYESVVRSFTREHILNFYSTWYAPNNMALIVVGDFETAEAAQKIRRTFRGFRPSRLPTAQLRSEPAQRGLRHALLFEDVEESYLDAAFHIPTINHDDILPLDVASVVLGYGESSRLYLEVRDRQQVVNSVYAYCFTPKHPGLFLVGGTLAAEAAPDAIGAEMRELKRLRTEPVGEAELEKAKLTIESEFVFQKETVQGQARKFGFFEVLMGDVVREHDYLKALSAVTAADIQRVAQRYFKAGNLTIGLMVPSAKRNVVRASTITKAAKQALSAPLRRTRGGGSSAAPRTLNGDAARTRSKAILHRLDNGIRLIIKENPTVPVLAVRAMCLGGVRFETLSTNGTSNFVAEMLTKGTSRRSASELAKSVESMGGALQGFSGRNTIGINAEFLSRYSEAGFDLFTEVLREASFEQDEIDKKRTEILAAIREQQDDLGQLAFNLLNRTFYGRHPYGLEQLGRKASVIGLQRQHLVRFYQRVLQPRNLVISIVGDVDASRTLQFFERALGGWKPKGGSLPKAPVALPPGRLTLKQIIKDRQQAHLVLGFPGSRFTDPNRFSMIVLNALLGGQGGRLFLELRDKRSMAYAVSSFLHEGFDLGMFGVYIATSPEKLHEAYDGIVRELQRMTEKAVSSRDLARAKKFLAGNYEIGLQRNSFQANLYAFSELHGLGFSEHERFARNIMKVRAADVLAAARASFTMQRFAIALLRPSGISFQPHMAKYSAGLHLKAARR